MDRISPVLLLDIDGVLNPYAAEGCPEGYEEHPLFADEEPVRLCRRHGEWIAELAGVFDVVWASAWGEEANRRLGPLLDLGPLPFVQFPAAPFPPALKVPAVARHVRDRPFVWIDDMLPAETRDWAAARTAPTLLLEVDPVVGLVRDTVELALRWAAHEAEVDPAPPE